MVKDSEALTNVIPIIIALAKDENKATGIKRKY